MSHIINDCPVNGLSLKVVSQLYTPLPILPESSCAEFTAYAKEERLSGLLHRLRGLAARRRTRDRKVAGSTSGRGTIKSTGQLSLPSLRGR